jgi:hypothetical protein
MLRIQLFGGPNHPIFDDPLFETPEYKRFEVDVCSAVAIAVEEDPHAVAIQKAIPAVSDRLRTMTGVPNLEWSDYACPGSPIIRRRGETPSGCRYRFRAGYLHHAVHPEKRA